MVGLDKGWNGIYNDSLLDIIKHLDYLKALVEDNPSFKTILEIGVREGNSTQAFLIGAAKTGAKVTSIDIEDCKKVSKNPDWKFIQGDSKKVKWNKQIDILFIDSSHNYIDTLKELYKFGKWVKPGGYIIVHDTVQTPVAQAIECYLHTIHRNCSPSNNIECNGLCTIKIEEGVK